MTKKTLAAAFPAELSSQADAATAALTFSSYYEVRHFSVNVNGEAVWIPCRVYSLSNDSDLSGLTLQQRQIAKCILTRSTDGFERQAALQEVMPINQPWSIPFVIALIGEYVVEIIEDILAATPQLDRDVVAMFVAENPTFHKVTCDRVMSYWDCYYRGRIKRSDYVGFKLLRELDTLIHR